MPRKETIMNENGNQTSQENLTSFEADLGGSELHFDGNVTADARIDSDGDLTVDVKDNSELKGRLDKHLLEVIEKFVSDRDAKRQKIEDVRANHRNFNRMLTLVAALVIGLIVTYGLSNMGFPFIGIHFPVWTAHWAPYSFVITVALDCFLAGYSYIRHY